jgi:hypothetical protein
VASTYEAIASHTLSSSAASYEFTSIPGTFTDLIVVVTGGASGATNLWMQFNSDTGSNYSMTRVSGNGSAASSTRGSSLTEIRWTGQSYIVDEDKFNAIIQIQSYANTNVFKSALGRLNLADGGLDAVVGLWRSTSAISAVKAFVSSGTFDSGSTFSLYGLAAA